MEGSVKVVSLYNLLFKAWGTVQDILTRIKDIQSKLKLFGGIAQDLADQRLILERILAAVEPLPAVRILFDVVLDGQFIPGVESMKITDSQKFTATISPVDAKGNPASVDGVPVWAAPDATIVTVTPAADGMSAEISSTGPIGSVQVSVTADADLGTGTKPLVGTLQVDVVGGEAVALQVNTSNPVEQ